MKMTDKSPNDTALEALFESARAETPELAPDFLARLVGDADAAIAAQNTASAVILAPVSLWSRIVAAFVPVSGLAAATLAGVWIGFQVPSSGFTDRLAFSDGADFDVSAFLPAVALSGFSELETDG
ncbi:hypothetical protein BOA8489_02331 [Boseongicola aestuarii]|uniref:Dihydroorotate dehydrogenase n=2 Tax=Boseongicola aestuarii TaxID=1470561 RepID=A0A238J0G9_9RHOB|nr:hypothetical protein BOA8489_02331 [Boseongicola aestuarii]